MSSTPPSGGTVFVEALEARIAPTGLYAIAGNPLFASDPHYVSYATLPTANSLGFVKASAYLGAGAPDNLYAIKLTGDGGVDANGASTGDELIVFNTVTGFNRAVPLTQANKGPIIAFFLDDPTRFNSDPTHVPGQVYADELVGVSMGKKTILTINGNVHGDIVTNLLNAGNTVSLTSDGRPSQGINGLTMNGNVFGNILAGGNVKSVNIVGSVGTVLAGTASNGIPYNFSGNPATPTGTISNTGPQEGHHGANINQFTVSSFFDGGRLQAGDGGFTAVGGAITNVRVLSDTGSFSILAGAGGGGAVGVIAGTGGVVGQVIVRGAAGTVQNSPIVIQAGHGGDNAIGHGGTGGAVSGLAIGYEDGFNFVDNTGGVSADLLMQNVIVVGGQGGSGIKGGNGGLTSNVFVNGFIPDDGATAADGSTSAEIQVFGGAGGVGLLSDRGKGGHGGNVATGNIVNQDVEAAGLTSLILVQGGQGGAGKGGGNVNGLDLLGTNITVNGGNGGSGINKGGGGGSLNAIAISNLNNLLTHQLILNAGSGGDGSNGHGGNGGNISALSLSDADLNLLLINSGTHANGGRGGNGYGGSGGSVGAGETAPVTFINSSPSGTIAAVSVRAGQGGDGSTDGGVGGGMDTFQLLGLNFNYALAAGAGGSAIGGQGRGGDGGSLAAIGITNAPTTPTAVANPTTLGGALSSGTGGNGAGNGGVGGKGGDIAAVNITAIFDAGITAGGAGNGPSGAGPGGTIIGAAALSLQGQVAATAGAGGQASGAASDGGSISGFIAAAQSNIYMVAGNGGSGGSGGSVTNSGTTANSLSITLDQPTGVPNLGNLIITAGNGSGANGIAGAGGSVMGFTGSVADSGLTAITAGNGGGGDGATASGHGGGVDTIKLTGTNSASQFVNGFTAQTVIIDAGNGGAATSAARGRTGGSVSNVTIYNLDAGTVVQHIAAGDGAAGLRKGGAGGNLSEIHVGLPGDTIADIGIRSGVAYGYALGGAGGLFAGIGGSGGRHTGPNGTVNGITAEAIASIVAGKGGPQLCSQVENIFLSSADPKVLITPLANADGSFSNFDIASFVGSIQDPTAPGASTYKQGDGLIAAANLIGNTDFSSRNFVPEAVLTNSGNDRALVDYLEQNAQLFNTNPFVVTNPAPAFLG